MTPRAEPEQRGILGEAPEDRQADRQKGQDQEQHRRAQPQAVEAGKRRDRFHRERQDRAVHPAAVAEPGRGEGIARGAIVEAVYVAQVVVRVDRRVVDEGDVVTAGGVSSSIDLGLHLVERLAGSQARASIAKQMDYPYRQMNQ